MAPRNSQRVDRRRRVLVDESRIDESELTPRIFRGDADGPTCRYTDAALQSLNAPIAQYLPRRWYSLLVWFLVGLCPILGLLAADVQVDAIRHVVGSEGSRPFELKTHGNLVSWCSSVAFALAAMIMLGIYTVRRHRRDDYRGRFTVWRWGIASAVLVSIDATAGVHDAWQGLCMWTTNTPLLADGSVWWVGAWTIIFGAMIARLLLEMSGVRSAVAWTSAACSCYLWAAAVELHLAPVAPGYFMDISQVAALMLGHHFLLFGLLNYARHVVLEAMGIVRAPSKKTKQAPVREETNAVQRKSATGPKLSAISAADDNPVADQDEQFDRREVGAKQAPRSETVPPESQFDRGVADADDEENDARKLSKAERRRLRKEQRRPKAA